MEKIVEKIILDIENEIYDRDDSRVVFNPTTQGPDIIHDRTPEDLFEDIMEELKDRLDDELHNREFFDRFYEF